MDLPAKTEAKNDHFLEFLNVLLVSSKTGETEKGSLNFSTAPPRLVKDVKLVVEEEFNIPTFAQRLSFEADELRDETKLSYIRVRNGDTLRVEYTTKADCAGLKAVIEWLNQLVDVFKKESRKETGSYYDLQEIVAAGLEAKHLEHLCDLLSVTCPEVTSNKRYFHHHGGVDKLLEVYRSIVDRSWRETLHINKLLERKVLTVLGYLSAADGSDFAGRNYLIEVGAVELLTKSLMRVKLSEGEPIVDDSGQMSTLLVHVLELSAGVLSNLSEASKCQMLLATNSEVLDQLTCFAVTPTPIKLSSFFVASFFINLAYNTDAHQYITKAHLVKRLLNICKIRTNLQSSDETVMRYFIQLYFALVILPSFQWIPASLYEDISGHMTEFLRGWPTEEVQKWELKNGYDWSTLVPFLYALYLPTSKLSTGNNSLLDKLQLLSIKTILFALQAILSREVHREVLIREGLFDYVRCLPAHVPKSLRPQANEIVRLVSTSCDNSHLLHCPPSLMVIAKAYLAKMHFGLEKILTHTVGQLMSEVM